MQDLLSSFFFSPSLLSSLLLTTNGCNFSDSQNSSISGSSILPIELILSTDCLKFSSLLLLLSSSSSILLITVAPQIVVDNNLPSIDTTISPC
ncbi:GSCOCG00003932001-RA-CDS [Cotesia congregata]|nr:GSCOCG00003932001-RA-CDS [Cotesia congregata]